MILHRRPLTWYVLHVMGAQNVFIEVCGFLLACADALRCVKEEYICMVVRPDVGT